MPFCIKCGRELADGANFCAHCGTAVPAVSHENPEPRKLVYEGEIHKCPSCGEVLPSLVSVCPSCGYEFRGASASHSVREFALRLSDNISDEQKVSLIRAFPIPNTKEDIFEFMILASTNLDCIPKTKIYDAWSVKFEQSYQKAKLVFSNDADFIKFQSIYDKTRKEINKKSNIAAVRKTGHAIAKSAHFLPQIIVAIGWLISVFVLIPLCGVNLDAARTNANQIILMLDFIIGAILLPRVIRGDSVVPKLIITIGLILSIAILIPQCGKNLDAAGTNAFQIILMVAIISSMIIFVRTFKKEKKQ